jgi:hypothetical protein
VTSEPVHRELLLPDPSPRDESSKAPRRILNLAAPHPSWLELRQSKVGRVSVSLGAESALDLSLSFNALRAAIPGVQLGRSRECAVGRYPSDPAYLLRAVVRQPTHFLPFARDAESGGADLLLRNLAIPALRGSEAFFQVLFRRVPYWESGFLGSSYATVVLQADRSEQASLANRAAEPAYHVEVRAGLVGPASPETYTCLASWLQSWISTRGTPWWSLDVVPPRRRHRFWEACRFHDMAQFSGRKARRDIAGSELIRVLPIPQHETHVSLSYAGAPRGELPTELRWTPGIGGQALVGTSGDEQVAVPPRWHHLGVVGRTRSGKSTLVEHVVLQLLTKHPSARFVVLEPTGELVRRLVDRLPPEVAGDTVEVDPAHPSFASEDGERVTVPLNLIHLDGRRAADASAADRAREKVAGDLVQAFRNAWGEESLGGRADFVLRSVLNGLFELEGTNLVDAYAALSDKATLRRLAGLARGSSNGPLRAHLPRLDYAFTISTLDKVGKIATNPLLRKVLCQRFDPAPFDRLLDHRLLLLNLAKGAIGAEGANFLGAIFLSQLWSALQERERTDLPVYLVVDEFHNYAIPAFADMLSEGARLGLHVVAITQYLDRIPERVQAALLGNVDTWAIFPVGAGDAKRVWSIAHGAKFGWTPEHFASGLHEHQFALATASALVKVDADPPAPGCVECTPQARSMVLASSRRYARPEDSECSPLAVSPERLGKLLAALSRDRYDSSASLAAQLGWTRAEARAALALGSSVGDVHRGGFDEFGLTLRGEFHRDAIMASRNEGEEHCALVADVCAWLASLGPRPRIVHQGGGYLLPDAEFDWNGRTYSVEVECSSLTKHLEQIARNLRKAVLSGRRCLFAVATSDDAESLSLVMGRNSSGARLWREFGIVSPRKEGRFVVYEEGQQSPWGFLIGRVDIEEGLTPHTLTELLEAFDEADLAKIQSRVTELRAAARPEATLNDFRGVLGSTVAPGEEARRIGMALRSLGLRGQRLRQEGERVRVYDLREPPANPRPDMSRRPDP